MPGTTDPDAEYKQIMNETQEERDALAEQFNEPDGDSDQDDYEESGKKKKKKVIRAHKKSFIEKINSLI